MQSCCSRLQLPWRSWCELLLANEQRTFSDNPNT
jgi:hypothetical protein